MHHHHIIIIRINECEAILSMHRAGQKSRTHNNKDDSYFWPSPIVVFRSPSWFRFVVQDVAGSLDPSGVRQESERGGKAVRKTLKLKMCLAMNGTMMCSRKPRLISWAQPQHPLFRKPIFSRMNRAPKPKIVPQ